MNHDPIPEESPLVHGRTQSQAFCPISPEPCKFDYFKSAKTHAFPRASEFFTGDYLEKLLDDRRSDFMNDA